MIRRPPRSTRTDTLFPYTTLFRSQPVDGIGAGAVVDLQHLAAHLVHRLLPGDLRPLAVDQLGRMLQAALAVRMLADRRAPGTVRAETERAVPAGFLPDPDAVLHLRHPGAAHRAVRAHRLDDLDVACRR